jgi:SAM-dependent methyltransferase
LNNSRRVSHALAACVFTLFLIASGVSAQDKPGRFEPKEGMAGKDVVWVPTPDFMVQKMLDIGKVTPNDFVIDVGSGDGRNVIAAAKRGANALGIEYNDKLVQLSRELAAEAGVADKAKFVQGDMYEADLSKADVLILFLLTENLNKLMPKFLDLRPGTRLVVNTFYIDNWDPDYTETVPNCSAWCTVYLRIVPAKVSGTWQMDKDTLLLTQKFQEVEGTLNRGGKKLKIEGRLNGDRLAFTAGGARYEGRVEGNRILGEGWTATRR